MDSVIPAKVSVLIDDNPTAATNTVTSDNTDVSDADTLTINGRVYTFKTTLTGAADEVLRGVTDADTTLAALRTLINSGRAAVAAGGTLTSDQTKPTAADTVVIGAKTYTFVAALTEKYATGTLTSDNTNVAAGDTVTIGSNVYTFVTSLLSGSKQPVVNQVFIGADADTSMNNLIAAINGAAGEGTKYSFGTVAHPSVTAGTLSSHAFTVTAKALGTGGNSIAKAETSSHLDWDGVGAVLTGGADSVANEISLVGADADAVMNNLIAAINGSAGAGTAYSTATVASTEVTAGALAAHAFAVTAITPGIAGNSLTKTESSTHLDWDGAGAVMTGGVDASAVNADVTCGAVTAHAVVLTSIITGVAANALTLAKSAAHLSITAGTFAGGGSTIGTADLPVSKAGVARILVTKAPQFTGTPTYTVALLDADGVQYYISGNLNENATTDTDIADVTINPGDTVKITTSSKVEETLPIVVELR